MMKFSKTSLLLLSIVLSFDTARYGWHDTVYVATLTESMKKKKIQLWEEMGVVIESNILVSTSSLFTVKLNILAHYYE